MTNNDNPKTISTEVALGSHNQQWPTKEERRLMNLPLIVVHKTNEEGGFLIGRQNGEVFTDSFDMPEWAAGYITAMLAERHDFYAKRLGDNFAAEHKSPAALNADDLAWLALDEEGQELEPIPASIEYRLGVVKGVLIASGVIQDIDAADLQENLDGSGVTTYETMVDLDRERTPEEIAAIEKASTTGFLPLKTGTQD